MKHLRNAIFSIKSEQDFEDICKQVFDYQISNNKIYSNYVNLLDKKKPNSISEIPFLPISFFKTHEIRTNSYPIENIFKSSGTGGIRSTHFIESLELYEESFYNTYKNQIGDPKNQIILALLPNYIEQGESSLVYMVNYLIQKSNHKYSGFYINDTNQIESIYNLGIKENKQIILFGVSYALLDLAKTKPNLNKAIIIETGGMKGKRKEVTKQELHKILQKNFNVPYISSEYGMTELLSQAYSNENQVFTTPKWMKILIREMNDPFSYITNNKTGGINVIDLANLYSCSFIATQDLGKSNGKTFEIIGRYDNSDIRGCNLLVE